MRQPFERFMDEIEGARDVDIGGLAAIDAVAAEQLGAAVAAAGLHVRRYLMGFSRLHARTPVSTSLHGPEAILPDTGHRTEPAPRSRPPRSAPAPTRAGRLPAVSHPLTTSA
jgi:hypothetical protein